MFSKLIGLSAFVLTGLGIIASSVAQNLNIINISILSLILFFFSISIKSNFIELKASLRNED